jgi:copper chaperone CopZ
MFEEKMKKVVIKIKGMNCGHCEKHVTEELEKVNGVKNIRVSASDGEAYLEVEDFVKEGDLKDAVKRTGYNPVEVING